MENPTVIQLPQGGHSASVSERCGLLSTSFEIQRLIWQVHDERACEPACLSTVRATCVVQYTLISFMLLENESISLNWNIISKSGLRLPPQLHGTRQDLHGFFVGPPSCQENTKPLVNVEALALLRYEFDGLAVALLACPQLAMLVLQPP